MLGEFSWTEAITSSPIFLALVLCSIAVLGIAIERAYYFWKRSCQVDDTLQRALKKVRSGQPREAAWVCENTPHPMGMVAVEVFKRATKYMESLEERMQVALSRQKLLLERNLNVLGTMAAVAPLIGLLGTVWGIMRAFSDMAQTGSAAPTVVAAGVAEALITTAAGLVVAVPALMLYNHFVRRMNVMLTIAENHARTLRTAQLEYESDSGDDAGSDVPPSEDASKKYDVVRPGKVGQPEPAMPR